MRDGFLPEDQERKPYRRKRAASLGVSLALHALVVYGLYQARMTIKILPLGREVRNVRLAPPVPMKVPERIEEYIRNSPAPGPFELGSRRRGPRTARPAPDEAPSTPSGGARRPSGLEPGNLMKDKPGLPPGAEAFPGGNLALSSRDREEDDGRLRINLLAIPDHVQDAPMGFEGGVPASRSLRRYTLPGREPVRGGTGRGTGPGGSGPYGTAGSGGGQRATATFQSPGYDISPWARLVIDRVQSQWVIPPASNPTGRSDVRIAVTIDREGAFTSFELQETADLDLFNAAAAAALRASEPLPPLPADFPARDLQAVFVFSYHD